MPDFPVVTSDLPLAVITNWDRNISPIADHMQATRGAATSAVYTIANSARLFSIQISHPVTVYKLGIANGTVVSGNIDVGIYDKNLNLVVSAGSTPQAGVSQIQTFDIADTVLTPGDYYLAVAMDNTTGTLLRNNNIPTPVMFALGCLYTGSGFPLPATLNPAGSVTSSFVPYIAAVCSGAVF